MAYQDTPFEFELNFNFASDSVFTQQFKKQGQPYPPVSGNMDLLDGSDMLLLDGTNMLLL